jgi:hypothetical protein
MITINRNTELLLATHAPVCGGFKSGFKYSRKKGADSEQTIGKVSLLLNASTRPGPVKKYKTHAVAAKL